MTPDSGGKYSSSAIDVPEARESPVKRSIPFPQSSHNLLQIECFWRKPTAPHNWSERTYSLATHKGEEINSPTPHFSESIILEKL